MIEDDHKNFYCPYCGKEITEEEYENCEGYCEDCYNDLMDEDFFPNFPYPQSFN